MYSQFNKIPSTKYWQNLLVLERSIQVANLSMNSVSVEEEK